MSASQRRPEFVALWEADPHCCYCGVETWLPESGVEHPVFDRAHPKHRMATREHVKGRNIGDPLTRGTDITLACWKCNCDRGAAENRAKPDAVRKRLSHPTKHGYVNLAHALAVDPDYLTREMTA